MSFGFSFGEFAALVEILLSIVLVLAGILVAVSALGFKLEVSGSVHDGSIQKAFNLRNSSRQLLRRYFWFGAVLVAAWLAVALLDFPSDSQLVSGVLAACAGVLLVALFLLCSAGHTRSTSIAQQ